MRAAVVGLDSTFDTDVLCWEEGVCRKRCPKKDPCLAFPEDPAPLGPSGAAPKEPGGPQSVLFSIKAFQRIALPVMPAPTTVGAGRQMGTPSHAICRAWPALQGGCFRLNYGFNQGDDPGQSASHSPGGEGGGPPGRQMTQQGAGMWMELWHPQRGCFGHNLKTGLEKG